MSAFEGVRLLRRQAVANPQLALKDVFKLVKTVEPMGMSLDWEASLYLHSVTDENIPTDGVDFYRHCIASLILTSFPTWAKLITLGRSRFMEKLYGEEFRDVRSLFRQAGLLKQPPVKNDVEWWDYVSGRVRLEGDRQKLERGRMAEELSLNFERVRMKREGVPGEPKWMAIEDNTVGYDILSYENGEYGIINKLIEVKSTIASPVRFFITRNEWNQAQKAGKSYCFHVWNLQEHPPRLYIKQVNDIAPHIPVDNEKGKWNVAEIPVSVG